MKKITLCLAAVLMATAMVLTACGNTETPAAEPNAPDAAVTESAEEDTTAEEPADDAAAADEAAEEGDASAYLQGMVDELQPMLDQMNTDDTMDIAVSVRENSLVYTYTFLGELEITDEVKAQFETQMEAQASTFETTVSEMKGNVPNVTLIVEYKDKNGEMIYSREFK